uniref:Major facilitator superfamily (MFS) profile domain-containing protein n=1 Tax=Leersia perrieri TaxID=77586 RepID=A0A0D9VPL8_9ORYZ
MGHVESVGWARTCGVCGSPGSLAAKAPYHHWTLPSSSCTDSPSSSPTSGPTPRRSSCRPRSSRRVSGQPATESPPQPGRPARFGFLYTAQPQDKAHVDAGYKPGIGVRNALFVLAACNLLGFLMTWMLVPESKGQSLEEMSGEVDNEEDSAHGVGAANLSGDEIV